MKIAYRTLRLHGWLYRTLWIANLSIWFKYLLEQALPRHRVQQDRFTHFTFSDFPALLRSLHNRATPDLLPHCLMFYYKALVIDLMYSGNNSLRTMSCPRPSLGGTFSTIVGEAMFLQSIGWVLNGSHRLFTIDLRRAFQRGYSSKFPFEPSRTVFCRKETRFLAMRCIILMSCSWLHTILFTRCEWRVVITSKQYNTAKLLPQRCWLQPCPLPHIIWFLSEENALVWSWATSLPFRAMSLLYWSCSRVFKGKQ